MIDLYYANLSRSVLNKALGELQTAQEYMVRAGMIEGHIKRIQRSINSIRDEIDVINRIEIADRDYGVEK